MNIDLSQYSFDSVAVNMVVAWLIQKIKLSGWPVFNWINSNTPKTTAFISVVMAAVTAAGMSVDWQSAGGAGTLMISGITLSNVALFIWYVIKNTAFQHGAYKVMFQAKPTADQIAAAMLIAGGKG